METGAEVIATEVLLFEIELGEGMGPVHDRLDAFGASHLADRLHRSDLPGDVDLMRHEDEPGAIGNSFLKGSRDLIEVLARYRNLNELQLKAFPLLTLPRRC